MEEKPSLKSTAERLAIAAGWGGSSQLLGEVIRIVTESNPEKFPDGWASLNISEEIIEGALPALTGAIAGKLTYSLFRSKANTEYNPGTEKVFMYTGAGMGYASMFVAGAVLHEYLDVPDVKWGPFK